MAELENALNRVRSYLDGLGSLRGNHPEEIHAIWINRENVPRILLVSDLRVLLAQGG